MEVDHIGTPILTKVISVNQPLTRLKNLLLLLLNLYLTSICITQSSLHIIRMYFLLHQRTLMLMVSLLPLDLLTYFILNLLKISLILLNLNRSICKIVVLFCVFNQPTFTLLADHFLKGLARVLATPFSGADIR